MTLENLCAIFHRRFVIGAICLCRWGRQRIYVKDLWKISSQSFRSRVFWSFSSAQLRTLAVSGNFYVFRSILYLQPLQASIFHGPLGIQYVLLLLFV